jgi:hypothetical protein
MAQFYGATDIRVPVAFLFPGFYDEMRKKIRKMEANLSKPGQLSIFDS